MTPDRAKAVLGAFEAFETLAKFQPVRFACLVNGEPIEITVTAEEMVELLRAAVTTVER